LEGAKMSKFPWWVVETDQCIWCRQEAKLFNVCVSDAQDGVEIHYVCENPKCEHFLFFKIPNKVCIIQQGKGAVEVFNRKMKEPEVTKVDTKEVVV
jgi:hypothetical protein